MFDEQSFSSESFEPQSWYGLLETLGVAILVAAGAVVATGQQVKWGINYILQVTTAAITATGHAAQSGISYFIDIASRSLDILSDNSGAFLDTCTRRLQQIFAMTSSSVTYVTRKIEQIRVKRDV